MIKEHPLLSVCDIRTSFDLRRWGFIQVGNVRAVDGVDFHLHRGESIAIVGESGSGKSTLVKTILGLHMPGDGEILFEGRKVIPSSRNLRLYRSQIGYVQQDPYASLPPFMNVRRILEEPLRINGVKSKTEREERLHQALRDVRLTPTEDYLSKFPHMLSGGQQQRVGIARAMIMRPKLLLADEPVSMLDASVRIEILELLRTLQRAYGVSLLYITHDLSTVRYFADRILVMYAGKIVEEAPAPSLMQNPAHPYTQALLAAIPDLEGADPSQLRPLPPGEAPSLVSPPLGCRFHPRCTVAVKGVCDRNVPPFFPSPMAGGRVACWHYERNNSRLEQGGYP